MYSVSKDGTRIVIRNWKDEVVYSADPDSIIIYESGGGPITSKIKDLTDEQLLLALTKAIKLPF
jgi:hypothetical protein